MISFLQAVLVIALLAVTAYGAWEVRRWGTTAGREQVSPRQRRIRAWGFAFLMAALALWLRGTALPLPPPHHAHAAARYIAYWMAIALLVLPLIPLALLDARENLRRALSERESLRREMLGGEE